PPAMLDYLDNTGSIGPNSDEGIVRNRGLNENLAREILELHTLGVRTVYSQVDVTNLAKVITVWTFLPTRDNPPPGPPSAPRKAYRPQARATFRSRRAPPRARRSADLSIFRNRRRSQGGRE